MGRDGKEVPRAFRAVSFGGDELNPEAVLFCNFALRVSDAGRMQRDTLAFAVVIGVVLAQRDRSHFHGRWRVAGAPQCGERKCRVFPEQYQVQLAPEAARSTGGSDIIALSGTVAHALFSESQPFPGGTQAPLFLAKHQLLCSRSAEK